MKPSVLIVVHRKFSLFMTDGEPKSALVPYLLSFLSANYDGFVTWDGSPFLVKIEYVTGYQHTFSL